MSTPPVTGTGDGTRPTTSGGVDNIGAGEKFSSTKKATGETPSGPAPGGHMPAKRTVETTRHDDSAAFELKEDLTPARNHEPEDGGRP
ncbi:hypothetical protein QTI33_08255 [Variovorax sp. J22P271]|uniref:hypothetical protein n=1 Tax=Variovorax davisae TaxID=3053515 RepID=UPI0025772C84|nr:hypothetical protein [Variovorax sp. J22P271]MDM0032127.1 hypothetical protein [Variovorax sp. J22P271]